jgi:hypothetical protein
MSMTDWRLQGYDFSSCNCAWGCPCQFMALPTTGRCTATAGFQVTRGHHGNTRLDGLLFGGLFSWPGPIHEGNGEGLPLVDIRATPAQREALLKIMSGQDTEPGATFFQVFFSMLTKVHEPQFVPIRFEIDLKAGTAHFSVDGLIDARAEPIRNPITREPTRARLVLPQGFEFTEAEFASSTVSTGKSPIDLHWTGRHAHLARLDVTGKGVVRAS